MSPCRYGYEFGAQYAMQVKGRNLHDLPLHTRLLRIV